MLKRSLFILLVTPGIATAQSPFDGTWRIAPASFKVPQAPAEFLLVNGMFRCKGCLAAVAIKADGREHGIPDSPYWNTATVRSKDARTVEIEAKKNGKTCYTETDTLSADGRELTQLVRDTTEAEAVTTTTSFHRIDKGPAGAHAISGSWRAYKVEKSPNSLIISTSAPRKASAPRHPSARSTTRSSTAGSY